MNLTQLERIKMELKHALYEQNKMIKIKMRLLRFQGLTQKLSKTHQIVLAKRLKDRVRSTKWLG
jgi:hypothetical protein